MIERFKLNSVFDSIVSSHQVGYCKPAKQIFEALVQGIGVRPEELVYSDDNAERLEGAKELGIQNFQFHNFEQFLGELKTLGINLEGSEKLHG